MAIKDDIDCLPHPSKGKSIVNLFNFLIRLFVRVGQFSSIMYDNRCNNMDA